MKRLIIIILLFSGLTSEVFSQASVITGNIIDESGAPICSAPVVLLYPADSTMAFFGLTNERGFFEIKGVRNGKYLLQVAFIGHQTVYRELTTPGNGVENIGSVMMKSKPISLGEVFVTEEYVPLRFRTDTIEFNTAAFKTKPDAVVEDLIKKLPGMEVDRAGNIKAMGEDVEKILVDGKEFFGSDIKLASRNVPSDALKKVQIFDKKSDESDFTGIDDGIRDKTINLVLKDDKKDVVFGELLAGGATDLYYQGSGKVYKFTSKEQFAALGMVNNINQFGFSFKDYIDFTRGIQSEGGHGGEVQIRLPSVEGSSFPINFGKPVSGLSTSGAGGLNYSRVYKKDSRIFMSFIANGSDKDLLQTTLKQNFTDVNSYLQQDSLDEVRFDMAQRINFGLRNRIDSTQNILINGSAALSTGKTESIQNISLLYNESEKNRLSTQKSEKTRRFLGNVNGSYLKLVDRGKTVFRLSSDASFMGDIGNRLLINDILLNDAVNLNRSSQLQDNKTGFLSFSGSSSVTRKIGEYLYVEPEFKTGIESESLNRTQGTTEIDNERIDSLSLYFTRQYQWLRPDIRIIRNTAKTQLTLALQMELGKTVNSLNKDKPVMDNHYFFTPGLSWEYEYRTGRRLRFNYQTAVNVPTVNQLLPVINNSNPLMLNWGNRNLKPEHSYNLLINWWIFDQYSFTSFMTALSATCTKDKINPDRRIDKNLMQSMSLINVPEDYRIQSTSDFSTPVRKLGIKINTNMEATWNRGLSYVNGVENINTNFTQRVALSIENRKKIRWDINIGGSFRMTYAVFSIQKTLNNRYVDYSYFTEISYNLNKHWNFQFTADVTNFNSQSFKKAISIPLLGAQISYYFFKNNRGSLILHGTDLLNMNTGIERTNELNFLQEQRSNMLGRFLMFSFKYRLNKYAGTQKTYDIKGNKL